MLRFLIVFCALIWLASSHEEGETRSCVLDPDVRIQAYYMPGLVTVDGNGDDWSEIDGFELSLLPALDPDEENKYKGGKMTMKALHDGTEIYFLLQVEGKYIYSTGKNKNCPSVALMFQIGENATYHDMGGCKDMPGTCTSKSCKGHEVDIMHFSIGTAIPGRIYGGNYIDNAEGSGGDRFGHLVDLYAWNPHCRDLDGRGPSGNDTSAQNNWRGAWWHDSLMSHSGYIEEDSPYGTQDQKGTYYFEFSRPLWTTDRLRQDLQFTIGQTSKVAVAFWYPTDGKAWGGSDHYSGSCDWIPLDISSPGMSKFESTTRGSHDITSAFSLLLSVISLCLSVFVVYKVSRSKTTSFTPIDQQL